MNSLANTNRTILLTGATGFLGSHLLEGLLERGNKVVAVKRSTSNLDRVEHLLDMALFYDLDKTPLEEIFAVNEIHAVIHTACCYGRRGENMSDLTDANVLFPLRVLETARKNNVKVFVNTDTILHRETSPYSLSKAQFSDWFLFFAVKMKIINLRLEHMYGPGDSNEKFLPRMLEQMLTDVSSIPLTAGEQKRDFIYIDDIVAAFIHVLERNKAENGLIQYDVGTDRLVTIKDFVTLVRSELEEQLGRSVKPVFDFGSIPYRLNEMMTPEMNIKPLFDLGWKPEVSLEQGLKKTIGNLLRTVLIDERLGN